jgi:L-aspartate oxidase
MLECLVFGRRAANDISGRLAQTSEARESNLPEVKRKSAAELDFAALREEIQHLMSDYCGVLRNKTGLQKAQRRIREITSALESGFASGRAYIETLNLLSIASAVLAAALGREKSVGAHYREDNDD